MSGPTGSIVRAVTNPERGQSRWWRVGYPLSLVAVVLVAGVLVWMGRGAILSNTDGTLIRTVDDPAEPGYEALVQPTPTFATVIVDADRNLSAVAVLALAGERSGSVVMLPPFMTVRDGDGDPRQLGDVFVGDGLDATVSAAAGALNAAIGDARLVDAAQWSALVTPVGPLEFTNAETVTAERRAVVGDEQAVGEITFAAGEITVAPNEVGAFLSASVAGESDLNRMVRHQRFWGAWLEAVSARLDDPDILPGESTTGIGRFVRSLAATEVELATVPVLPLPSSSGTTQWISAPEQTANLVARLIPFPVGPAPGARVRIRILDGTGQLANGVPAVEPLVSGGAEVATIGNAAAFDYVTTQFIVAGATDPERAEALQAALGVGEVVTSADRADAVDITVILGRDAVARLGGTGD
jgi:hypothetical protein